MLRYVVQYHALCQMSARGGGGGERGRRRDERTCSTKVSMRAQLGARGISTHVYIHRSLNVRACVFMHLYMHAHAHVYASAYICMYRRIHMYVRVSARVCVRVSVRVPVRVCVCCVCVCVRARARACVHACIHACWTRRSWFHTPLLSNPPSNPPRLETPSLSICPSLLPCHSLTGNFFKKAALLSDLLLPLLLSLCLLQTPIEFRVQGSVHLEGSGSSPSLGFRV